ncbi:MAG: GNAT family N-acetyltransferase [Flavobacteriales bacterium]|nr:GNAT family N-acetyltransferase [Flavobacteriales bacterium]
MITIREGKKADLPYILQLIKELAEYENAIHKVAITLDELEVDGFGEKPYYYFLVAEQRNKIIGMTFYFIRYSTWKGKVLFLEDFIVSKEYRRMGVGKKLFDATIKICKKLNAKAMCWQVLDWNKSAISFYKKYNAEISNDWLDGRLNEKQINNLIISI